MEKQIFLIIGLGNPGEKYAHTRHNAGFEVMDLLEKQYAVTGRRQNGRTDGKRSSCASP